MLDTFSKLDEVSYLSICYAFFVRIKLYGSSYLFNVEITQWNNFKSVCWVQCNYSEIPLDKWRLNHFTKVMMSYENDTKISSHDSITLLRIHISQRETWKSSLNFSPCGNNIYNRKRSVMTCGNKDMFSLLKLHKW